MAPKGFHYATENDWNGLEKEYGIDLEKIIYNDEYENILDGCAFKLNEQERHSYLYVGSPNIDLWEEFASASDWVDMDGTPNFPNTSRFNIKPFGRGTTSGHFFNQGYGAEYYSCPSSVRTFFSLEKGKIGHYGYSDYYVYSGTITECSPIRLVKDIK